MNIGHPTMTSLRELSRREMMTVAIISNKATLITLEMCLIISRMPHRSIEAILKGLLEIAGFRFESHLSLSQSVRHWDRLLFHVIPSGRVRPMDLERRPDGLRNTLHRKIQAGIKIHSILETVTAYMLS
jgi:hypothetical protein